MPAPTGLKKPATFDHLKKKQPLQRTVMIPLSQDSVDALHDAEQALERAKILGEEDRLPDLQAAYDAAREAALEDCVEMTFRSMGRRAYDDLIESFPATEEQKAEWCRDNPKEDGTPADKYKGPSYDVEAFNIHLVAGSCVEPKMTPEQVKEIFDEWNSTEIAELCVAASEVNTNRRVVQLGNG